MITALIVFLVFLAGTLGVIMGYIGVNTALATIAVFLGLLIAGMVFYLFGGRTLKIAGGVTEQVSRTIGEGAWWRENRYSILIFLVLTQICILAIDPLWWWNNFLSVPVFMATIVIGVGALMAPSGKKIIHPTLGKIAIAIGVATLVFALSPQSTKDKWRGWWHEFTGEPIRTSDIPLQTTNDSERVFSGPNSHVQQVVYDILEHELPSTDAFKMTRIASCESGFRHFEDDGVTPLRGRKKDTGEIVPTVKGVFQIKEDAWPELKKLGYNIDRLEDNIHAAIWIHKQGLDNRWDCNEQVEEELGEARRDLITIIAPVGEWSEPLDVSTRYCSGGLGKHLWAMDDRGNEYEIDPTKPTVAIPTLSFRFKAYGNEPETLEFTCVKK